ncbi:MAG: lipocalin family protein [Aquaticitalea sp.]
MKKITLLLCALTFVFTSCNNDDDDSTSTLDPIIGTWTYHKSFYNGVEVSLTDCEKRETFLFMADGVVDYKYYENDTSGNCLLEEDASGTWTNNENNVYAIDFGSGPSANTLTFENNTFYYDDVYVDDTYREVFIRN